MGTMLLRREQAFDGGDDLLTIEHADPRVKIAAELLDFIKAGRAQRIFGPPYAEVEGYLVRIRADNRTVVYRLICHITDENVYLAEWV